VQQLLHPVFIPRDTFYIFSRYYTNKGHSVQFFLIPDSCLLLLPYAPAHLCFADENGFHQ
jgi:hypothetical protein